MKFDHISGTPIELCNLDFGMAARQLSNRQCSRCASEVFYVVRALTKREQYDTEYFAMCEGCKMLVEIQ